MTASRMIAAAGAALLAGAFGGAARAAEPTEITFFIWAGSNQGIVPQEVIKAYKEKNPKVEIEILESNNAITFPKMVATKRTTPDKPLVHCGFFNVNSITKGDVEGHVGEARARSACPTWPTSAQGLRAAGRARRRLHDVGASASSTTRTP